MCPVLFACHLVLIETFVDETRFVEFRDTVFDFPRLSKSN